MTTMCVQKSKNVTKLFTLSISMDDFNGNYSVRFVAALATAYRTKAANTSLQVTEGNGAVGSAYSISGTAGNAGGGTRRLMTIATTTVVASISFHETTLPEPNNTVLTSTLAAVLPPGTDIESSDAVAIAGSVTSGPTSTPLPDTGSDTELVLHILIIAGAVGFLLLVCIIATLASRCCANKKHVLQKHNHHRHRQEQASYDAGAHWPAHCYQPCGPAGVVTYHSAHQLHVGPDTSDPDWRP